MSLALTPSETFLADFHDRHPGATSRAFKSLPAVRSGEVAASSYHLLASLVADDAEPVSVLDMACGDGYLLSLIASERASAANLVGVDISAGELAAAGRRLGRRATLHRARAQTIPLPDGSMDYVFCHMALMLMDDLCSVIGETRRVLRRGGVFSCMVGANPPASVALDLYLARLRAARRLLGLSVPTLGDRRARDPEGIRTLLMRRFTNVVSDEVLITRRYTPAELWSWFEEGYDLADVPPREASAMRAGCLEELSPLCEPDGRIEFTNRLCQVRAVAV